MIHVIRFLGRPTLLLHAFGADRHSQHNGCKPTSGSARFRRRVDLAGSEAIVRHAEENCAWAADLENNDAGV